METGWTSAMQLQDQLEWGGWTTCANPELQWPEAAMRGATPFQRLLLLQACRPERLESGMAQFGVTELGEATVSQVMRASQMYVNISHAWFLNDR